MGKKRGKRKTIFQASAPMRSAAQADPDDGDDILKTCGLYDTSSEDEDEARSPFSPPHQHISTQVLAAREVDAAAGGGEERMGIGTVVAAPAVPMSQREASLASGSKARASVPGSDGGMPALIGTARARPQPGVGASPSTVPKLQSKGLSSGVVSPPAAALAKGAKRRASTPESSVLQQTTDGAKQPAGIPEVVGQATRVAESTLVESGARSSGVVGQNGEGTQHQAERVTTVDDHQPQLPSPCLLGPSTAQPDLTDAPERVVGRLMLEDPSGAAALVWLQALQQAKGQAGAVVRPKQPAERPAEEQNAAKTTSPGSQSDSGRCGSDLRSSASESDPEQCGSDMQTDHAGLTVDAAIASKHAADRARSAYEADVQQRIVHSIADGGRVRRTPGLNLTHRDLQRQKHQVQRIRALLRRTRTPDLSKWAWMRYVLDVPLVPQQYALKGPPQDARDVVRSRIHRAISIGGKTTLRGVVDYCTRDPLDRMQVDGLVTLVDLVLNAQVPKLRQRIIRNTLESVAQPADVEMFMSHSRNTLITVDIAQRTTTRWAEFLKLILAGAKLQAISYEFALEHMTMHVGANRDQQEYYRSAILQLVMSLRLLLSNTAPEGTPTPSTAARSAWSEQGALLRQLTSTNMLEKQERWIPNPALMANEAVAPASSETEAEYWVYEDVGGALDVEEVHDVGVSRHVDTTCADDEAYARRLQAKEEAAAAARHAKWQAATRHAAHQPSTSLPPKPPRKHLVAPAPVVEQHRSATPSVGQSIERRVTPPIHTPASIPTRQLHVASSASEEAAPAMVSFNPEDDTPAAVLALVAAEFELNFNEATINGTSTLLLDELLSKLPEATITKAIMRQLDVETPERAAMSALELAGALANTASVRTMLSNYGHSRAELIPIMALMWEAFTVLLPAVVQDMLSVYGKDALVGSDNRPTNFARGAVLASFRAIHDHRCEQRCYAEEVTRSHDEAGARAPPSSSQGAVHKSFPQPSFRSDSLPPPAAAKARQQAAAVMEVELKEAAAKKEQQRKERRRRKEAEAAAAKAEQEAAALEEAARQLQQQANAAAAQAAEARNAAARGAGGSRAHRKRQRASGQQRNSNSGSSGAKQRKPASRERRRRSPSPSTSDSSSGSSGSSSSTTSSETSSQQNSRGAAASEPLGQPAKPSVFTRLEGVWREFDDGAATINFSPYQMQGCAINKSQAVFRRMSHAERGDDPSRRLIDGAKGHSMSLAEGIDEFPRDRSMRSSTGAKAVMHQLYTYLRNHERSDADGRRFVSPDTHVPVACLSKVLRKLPKYLQDELHAAGASVAPYRAKRLHPEYYDGEPVGFECDYLTWKEVLHIVLEPGKEATEEALTKQLIGLRYNPAMDWAKNINEFRKLVHGLGLSARRRYNAFVTWLGDNPDLLTAVLGPMGSGRVPKLGRGENEHVAERMYNSLVDKAEKAVHDIRQEARRLSREANKVTDKSSRGGRPSAAAVQPVPAAKRRGDGSVGGSDKNVARPLKRPAVTIVPMEMGVDFHDTMRKQRVPTLPERKGQHIPAAFVQQCKAADKCFLCFKRKHSGPCVFEDGAPPAPSRPPSAPQSPRHRSPSRGYEGGGRGRGAGGGYGRGRGGGSVGRGRGRGDLR